MPTSSPSPLCRSASPSPTKHTRYPSVPPLLARCMLSPWYVHAAVAQTRGVGEMSPERRSGTRVSGSGMVSHLVLIFHFHTLLLP